MIGAVFASIGVLFLPGVLILLRKEIFSPLSVIEKLPLCIAISLSYWIIAFWWLSLIPLSLGTLIGVTLIASGIVYVVLGKHASYIGGFAAYFGSGIVPIFFLFIAVPQVLLFAGQLVPSGQDMSMHTYIATIILQKNAFPLALTPIVPVSSFGLYPFGFSTIIAVMSTVNTLPPYTNALVLTGLVHFLFDYSLYSILRTRFTPLISAMVAGIVAWTSANPHLFVTWGANPSVLSLSLLFLAIAVHMSNTPHRIRRVLSVWLFAASFLTNYMFGIAAMYIGLPIAMYLLWKNRRRHDVWGVAGRMAVMMAPLVAPLSIKFFSLGWKLTDDARFFIQRLHYDETALWNGSFSRTGLDQIAAIIGGITDTQLLIIAGIAYCYLLWRMPRRSLVIAYIVMFLCFFVVNARYWWLPLSSVLYPYRIVLFLLLPISYLLALFFTRMKEEYPWLYPLLCIGFVMISIPRFRMLDYTHESMKKSMVTANDISAITYLRTITKPTDVIWNSYDDAGLWIPAIIARPITTYHTNPVDRDEIAKRPSVLPRYVYVGDTSDHTLPFSETITAEFPDAVLWEYHLLYARGRVKLYEITHADNN